MLEAVIVMLETVIVMLEAVIVMLEGSDSDAAMDIGSILQTVVPTATIAIPLYSGKSLPTSTLIVM